MKRDELAEAFRRNVIIERAGFEPSGDLPQRIAHRTFQLERRRRIGLVGGAAVVAAIALIVPTQATNLAGSGDGHVSAPFLTTETTDRRRGTATTIGGDATPAGGADAPAAGPAPKVAAKKTNRKEPRTAKKKSAKHRSSTPKRLPNGLAGSPASAASNTTRSATSSATSSTTTTTTTRPPPTTTTTAAPAPPSLAISGPVQVCSGASAQYQADTVNADSIVWTNGQTGSAATYTFGAGLPSSVGATATNTTGATASQSLGVQVNPVGQGPC